MAQTSTSQPNLWKPRYAAKAHQEKPQPAQQFTRSRSLREPFDAAELTRKLENYRQELKLEKARRELANKKQAEKMDKAEKSLGSAQPPPVQKDVSSAAPEFNSGAGVKRASSVSALKNLSVNEQPERRRSIIHRSRKQSAQEETPIEPAKPFVPRVAAKQFANTTTPIKEKSETAKTPLHQAPEPNKPKEAKPRVKDTSNKHVLDWNSPAITTKPASPPLPSAPEYPDAERTQARMHALHAFRDASKTNRPRPLSTALENMRDWDAVDNVYSSHKLPLHEEPEPTAASTYVPPSYRPALKAADRHDWAQGSQCGDSARQSLHLFRKKDSAHEEAEMAGLKAAMRPATKPRQKSHGDASDRLVGDAVKQIREERRRSSILNMFRRH
ncbi:hypothetical protein E4T49_08487 [Aureobasidium sp. EXF-10728]|nr:hypothetical protein E4T49_08487 [Aureobasidium sp. EXF-10728]